MSAPEHTSGLDLPAAPPLNEPAPDWRRLDPRMLVVTPLNSLTSLLPVLVGVVLFSSGDWGRLLFGLALVVLVIAAGVVRWLTTRYRITDDQVELHTGWLVRKRLATPRDRIRTVDLTAKLAHRLFGLTVVRVGTGRQAHGAEAATLALDAVTAAEAERLRQVLLRRAPDPPEAADQQHDPAPPPEPVRPATVLAAFSPGWLRYAPLSTSGLAAAGALFGTAMNLADDLPLDFDGVAGVRAALRWLVESPLPVIIATLAGAVLVLVLVCSMLVYLFQFWGHRLTREADNTIRARRGLLTTRSVSVQEHQLRGVEVSEPLLVRAGRGARCAAVTTGLSRAGESSLLLPPVPRALAQRVAAAVLRLPVSPTSAALARHPRRALARRLVRAVTPVLALAALLWGGHALGHLPAWPAQLALAGALPAVLLGVDRYRALGHALTEEYLVSRANSVVRRTVALRRTGIIGWRVSQSWLQRRAGLVTLMATTAAGHGGYQVPVVGQTDGLALADAAVPGLLTPFLVPPAGPDANRGDPARDDHSAERRGG